MELKKFVINGKELKYRNSEENVLIPVEYKEKDSYFRGAWVTSICNDFVPSTDKETMKKNLLKVLDYFKLMNLNAIVYHVRTYNNAYYKTDKAPIDPKYGTYESFDEWDYLKWFIDECHSRGIEFHAWLNPYRIKTNGYPEGTTPEDVAKEYKDFPNNPASEAKNILMTSSNGAILNPCLENVQQYIIDVCLEVMEKYNVDAIHFDDYFYAQMSPTIDVLNEPDQVNYIEYINNNPNCSYKEDNAEGKKQWRRDNVDKFIYDLSCAIRKFNKENNREVQLGISPTGIYSNGDGKVTYDENGTAITTGSNTVGQDHVNSYLFCDTKKWVDNEWIDYIVPQSYWGLSHPVAGFADVVDWWDKVVANKKVNLYCGMGIYMSFRETTYSWYENLDETADQVLYCNKLDNVKGTCIFSFKSLTDCIDDEQKVQHNATIKLREKYWNNKTNTPKTMQSK